VIICLGEETFMQCHTLKSCPVEAEDPAGDVDSDVVTVFFPSGPVFVVVTIVFTTAEAPEPIVIRRVSVRTDPVHFSSFINQHILVIIAEV